MRFFLLRFLCYLLFGVLCSFFVIGFFAPATWLDKLLNAQTGGLLRLADVQGNIWNGEATIVLGATQQTNDSHSFSIRGVSLPSRLHWELKPWLLLAGYCDLLVNMEGMKEPVLLSGRCSSLHISKLDLILPWVDFSGLGPPWSTLQPAGSISLYWEEFSLSSETVHLKSTLELHKVSSGLSPIKPLGSYRFKIYPEHENNSSKKLKIKMETIHGPLEFAGEGSFSKDTGFRFEAKAKAQPNQRDALMPLLELIGPSSGDDEFVINIS